MLNPEHSPAESQQMPSFGIEKEPSRVMDPVG
jgi:hypothetical protein